MQKLGTIAKNDRT